MQSQKAIDILEALVGFDTTSRNSNLDLIAWIESYLDRHGVAHERIPSPIEPKSNLWATIGPKDVPGYILSGHTDVVPVDGQVWTSDPFRLTERDGKLYGRGSCDMKGFVACCLAAVPAMLAQPLKQPIHLAFSYDEEVGFAGAVEMTKVLRDFPVKPVGCFVGEPTSMDIVVAHKSKRSFRGTVRGKTCHSSLAPEGVNAVEYAALVVAKVREIADRLRLKGARDGLYDLPFSTAHVGTLQGGTALNIVPDNASFLFEFRTIAEDNLETLTDEVVSYARDVLEPAMKAIDSESGITLDITTSFPGLDTAPEAEIIAFAKQLAGRNSHRKVAYGTEAGLFDSIGIPTVVIGPGSIDQAHKADEFIAVAELERCSAFLDRLVKHCAG